MIDLADPSRPQSQLVITLLLHVFRLFPFLVGGHRQLALENLALRQQLAVYRRTIGRPKLRPVDRLLHRRSTSRLSPTSAPLAVRGDPPC